MDNVDNNTEDVADEETADNIGSTENVENKDNAAANNNVKDIGDTSDVSVQKAHHEEKSNGATAMRTGSRADNVNDEHEHKKANKKANYAHTSTTASNISKRTDVIIDDIKDTCAGVLGQSISYTV